MTSPAPETSSASKAAMKRLIMFGGLAAVAFAIAGYLHVLPGSFRQESAVPRQVALRTDDLAAGAPMGNVVPVTLPTTRPAAPKTPPIRMNVWEWNAMMGLMFANGGPQTTVGSLMEQHGVTLHLTRQDDTEKSKPELQKLAEAMAKGDANPSVGIHFVVIMGDGAAQFLATTNKLLTKLGPEFRAEIVGAVGLSHGEDSWWGPPAWKASAEAMKGGVSVGVLRDGDWNGAMFTLANNGIKNNPDETTYDPEAMNWIASDDYLKAVSQLIAGQCDLRPVVRNGKLTGEKHNTCPEGVVTWTPGDVNLAKGKGGLVRLWSTKDTPFQMPAVIIGIHKWNVTHPQWVEGLLAAALDGGVQVKAFDAALEKAAQVSYAVYADKTPAYWAKYYKGTVERDRTQQPVELGGSSVMTLADNLMLFGLAEGTGGIASSPFAATYEGFGTLVSQQYPKLLPSFPPTTEAVNLTFLTALAAKAPTSAPAETLTFDTAAPITKSAEVGRRPWLLQFNTGQATFTPAAEAELGRLFQQLVIGAALSVEIDGHTDNTGTAPANLALSQARAEAVKRWLEAKAPTLFPANRVITRAFGDAQPVASNATAEGRAQNRRVVIVLGTQQ